MAYQSSFKAACTNKLCGHRDTIYTINGELPDGKQVCPKCGFNTLDWEYLSDNQIEVIQAALDKAGIKIA